MRGVAYTEQDIIRLKQKIIDAFYDEQVIAMTVRDACKAAGVAYGCLSKWRNEDETFGKELELARENANEVDVDFLEKLAMSRAKEKGKQSNSMIQFLLRKKGKKRGYGDEIHVLNTNKDPLDTEQDREMIRQYKKEILEGKDANGLPITESPSTN